MNTNESIDQMKQLNLQGMAEYYETQLSLPLHEQLQGHELVAQLVHAEQIRRINYRTGRYLKIAKLRQPALPELVECSSSRNLTKQQFSVLLEGSFIEGGQHVLITGATGCGKSYIACALAHHACALGYRTLYMNMNRFYEEVRMSKIENTYLTLLNKYKRFHVIVLDDFGLRPLDEVARMAFYQIIEDRFMKGALIITSQLPVNNWYDLIGEPYAADALMDRLTAKAHRIELKGESRRKESNNK
jgi:DNA replication protein DnaC